MLAAREALLTDGFVRFPATDQMVDWAEHASQAAEAALHDPAYTAQYQCAHTWFVGLDVLPNAADGSVGDSRPLGGEALTLAHELAGSTLPLHRGQVSVTFPGYPKPREGETQAAFGYRLNRDAAHVDGVLGEGMPKRRFVREPHAYILGVALNDAEPEAAPLVAWRGSHRRMHAAFAQAFQDVEPAAMGDMDVTETYVAARKRCFDDCVRVPLPLKRGESVLLHPMTLHGVAPWSAGTGHRTVAYFRPEIPGGVSAWLHVPVTA